jgi:transposase
MSKRRTSLKNIREIMRMHEEKKLSNRTIAKATGVSRPVVSQYIKDIKSAGLKSNEVQNMPDDVLLEILSGKKTSKNKRLQELTSNFDQYTKDLKSTGVNLSVLWEEYIRENPQGYSYTQFCFHYQVWKNASEISMHIEHKAGDKMFVDYTGKKLNITDRYTGELIPVETFVSILGASQLTFVEAMQSQKKEDFIRGCENALLYIGGVPKAIVPDCLKSAVTKADKYEPDLNPEYYDFARHYGTTILPARPYHPKDKALVENAVRIVYSWIFAKLRNMVFYTIEDLNKAIRHELESYNSKLMQRPKISRRDLFNETERDLLQPLPAERYEIKKYKRLKVQFNYHIYLSDDKRYYSVPYKYRARIVDLFYTENTVEIYENNIRIASHIRNRKANGYSTLDEHMPEKHKFMADWNPERFLSWAKSIGDDTERMIDIILSSKKHPEQVYKTCLGILNSAKKYSNERLNKACKMAIYYECYSYRRIKNMLVNNVDRSYRDVDHQPDLFTTTPVIHENVRGTQYYNDIGEHNEQSVND